MIEVFFFNIPKSDIFQEQKKAPQSRLLANMLPPKY